MAQPELHFGANIALGVADVAKQARWMEELGGYEYIAAGEHFMRGSPPQPTHASLPVMAVAAGATETLRVLSAVILVPFYHPTVLARVTASLDMASGGRLTLGVGVGGEYPVEFAAAGLNAKQRGRRTNECLEVLRRLWKGEQVTFEGRHFNLKDVAINPPPVQKPHPPVWVSGRRDVAMLRAVRHGDGWFPYFYSPERYRDSVAKITEYARQEGKDLSNFQWAGYLHTTIYPTQEEAFDVAAEELGGRYQHGRDFAEIVRDYCVAGTVAQCIDRIQEYIDAGARYIMFSISCRREDRARHVETIAKEIIPHFQKASA
jgi:probable F420-dependent oxidoreductase